MYGFNTAADKILTWLFDDVDKIIAKLIRKYKGPRVAETLCKIRIKWEKSLYQFWDLIDNYSNEDGMVFKE